MILRFYTLTCLTCRLSDAMRRWKVLQHGDQDGAVLLSTVVELSNRRPAFRRGL